jgi:circadian clock protein KaiB
MKRPNRAGVKPDDLGEEQVGDPKNRKGVYVLRLYVSGATPRSLIAVQNVMAVCEAHLQGRYTLEVIDIYQQPELAKREQLVATPTLIKQAPEPVRLMVGDLSNRQRLMRGLGIAMQQTGTQE